ncbi:glycosyltransferase family 4 protein [Methylococcus capsulatus]|uniref:glycosyltransferase family 4 protein n=1 Tax=Methylococcus capsulatus TaxID=414 RepID=UPI001C52EDD4|nr:glycosyltransferase [Methylococcus capsulatus]QXP88114.1 glycosyltransferase [Methylococcus capsulatus]
MSFLINMALVKNAKDRRVAIVAGSVNPVGGTEIYVGAAIQVLVDAGYQVSVYLNDMRIPSHLAGLGGVRFVDAGAWFLSRRQFMSDWRNIRRRRDLIADIIKNSSVAIFHGLHSRHLFNALAGHVKIVIAFHLVSHFCPAGTRYLPASNTLCDRRPGPTCLATDFREGCLKHVFNGKLPPLMIPEVLMFKRNIRMMSSPARALLFNSDAMRELVSDEPLINGKSYVINPPLIHAGDSIPGIYRRRNMVFVGRLDASKGCSDAIACLAHLPEQVTLDIVGDGREKKRLVDLSASLGVEQRIVWHGWIPTKNVLALLSSSGCLLVPSRLFEAWGQVGPQALSAGCPVVAYDVGGVKDWSLPGMTTYIEAGNVKKMADAAAKFLMEKRPLNESVVQEARTRFGMSRFGREYIKMVSSCIET